MKRELLIGCGHARDKRVSVDGNPHWINLLTLDNNPACNPDVICDLHEIDSEWGLLARNQARDGSWADYGIRSTGAFSSDFWQEIHAYEVLEHLGKQGDFHAFFFLFSELWRILKPGGFLCATVPSRFSPWLWGDPSHTRAILPETLVFLDQAQYIRQLDGPHKTAMSDFRHLYHADFRIVRSQDNHETHEFILQAVKPSRWTK